jgi:hypothetical protein
VRVHGGDDVRQTEMHTAEPSSFEVEITIGKLKIRALIAQSV